MIIEETEKQNNNCQHKNTSFKNNKKKTFTKKKDDLNIIAMSDTK